MNIQTPLHQAGDERDGYRRDFRAWARAQGRALRSGALDALDLANLAEEVEALGISQERELLSRLTVLIEHLLKFEHGDQRQPAAGWKRTIRIQRRELDRLLARSPSLTRLLPEYAAEAHQGGREDALLSFEEFEPEAVASYRDRLPVSCPYSVEQLLDPGFLPLPSA